MEWEGSRLWGGDSHHLTGVTQACSIVLGRKQLGSLIYFPSGGGQEVPGAHASLVPAAWNRVPPPLSRAGLHPLLSHTPGMWSDQQ